MSRYGGKFGVETDRMDKSAVGHDYIEKVRTRIHNKKIFNACVLLKKYVGQENPTHPQTIKNRLMKNYWRNGRLFFDFLMQ
jgi:hypothetical protein